MLEMTTDVGKADFHCHCDFSIDAKGSIVEYCDVAVERGLKELCFTTHYDTNPASEGDANYIKVKGYYKAANSDNLGPYVDAVRAAAKKYAERGLTVRLGLEFGYYPNCEDEAAKVKETHGIEYMLCGLHELENVCFCCAEDYEKCFVRYSLEQMLELYFGDMIAAAESKVFDTIAHFDYYKKYGLAFYGEDVLKKHEQFLPEVFRALRTSGTAIEINTAALRRGFSTHYPGPGIIAAGLAAGVKVSRLGSDAHTPEHVGFDFSNARALIQAKPDAVTIN